MANEKKCLVTQSLISSIDWFLKAPDTVIKDEKGGDGSTTWKEKARTDLVSSINREETPFPKLAQRGVEFEKMVYRHANKDIYSGSSEFQQVCELVRGYEFYQKGNKVVTISGNNCFLYAKYDAIKKDEEVPDLKDIKTTASYSKGKYLKTIQHKLYCYISGAKNFEYIIAEWNEYPKIKKIHTEQFQVEDSDLLEKEIIHRVEDCFEVIKDLGLWEDYRNTFCLY